MDSKIRKLVEVLTKEGKTISTMESCTGGGLVNAITNIEGASEVIKFSAVTYSNEFKIKMGVKREIIDKYSVYSKETAREMAKNIVKFSESDYGVGVTGKLNKKDPYNLQGDDDKVYFCIYDSKQDKYNDYTMKVSKQSRKENKNLVIEEIVDKILEILE